MRNTAGRRRQRHDQRVLKRGRRTRRDPARRLAGHTACRQARPESMDRDGGFLAAIVSQRRRTTRRGSRRNRLERRPCCRNIASVVTPVQTAHTYSSNSSSRFIIISYTSRPAIAGNPRCSVFKQGPKYNCEKRASNIALPYGVDVDK